MDFLLAIDQFFSSIFSGLWDFIQQTGQYHPYRVSWEIFKAGGWVVFLFIFLWGFWQIWIHYIQNKFAKSVEWVLLSISAPRYNELPPETAERMFSSLAGAFKSPNLAERYIKGMFQLSFSFEIVSQGGKIFYFVRTPSRYRDLVESAIYGAYPDAEISQVSQDYALTVPQKFPHPSYKLWGTELTLRNDTFYPIRTYPSFEYTAVKEFVDPLSGLLEVMGKIGPQEHIWFQIIITPISSDWRKKGEKLVQELLVEKTKVPSDEEGREKSLALSPGDKRVIDAIQKKLAKTAFRTKIRLIYFAPPDQFSKTRGVSGLLGALGQFDTLDMNGFKSYSKTKTSADYFFVEKRVARKQNKIVKNYINRDSTAGAPGFILNIEELASLYHFPVHGFKIPFIAKTSSRRGAPPSNLPLENLENSNK